MKKIYSTIMVLAMLVAALSFTACGGNDDEVGNDKAPIVGVWECTEHEYQTDFPDYLKEGEPHGVGQRIYFNADGTYSTSEETGRWTLNGSTLTCVEDNALQIPVNYKIEKLTSTELELSADIKLFRVFYKFKRV